ncbi:MAG: hypothetical protein IPK67_10440 [Planctomycetes bacterium]|nr:hypothetical protein [Planctomycetota bacterium]
MFSTTRRWAGPVLGVLALAIVVWFSRSFTGTSHEELQNVDVPNLAKASEVPENAQGVLAVEPVDGGEGPGSSRLSTALEANPSANDEGHATREATVRELDELRERFEVALNQNTHAAEGALALLRRSIILDLERQERYSLVSADEHVSMAGAKVPDGERRILAGGRLYAFQAREYPAFDDVGSLFFNPPVDKKPGHYARPALSPELVLSIIECYSKARQGLQPSALAK